MVIKKKIIVPPYDKEAERKYYREAETCPNCGYNKESSNKLSLEIPPVVEIREIGTNCHYYICGKCGCEWKVKSFKRKAKWGVEGRKNEL